MNQRSEASFQKTFNILMEAGFLWSIFFVPWGPVVRYFGWLLFLIGFGGEFFRRKKIPASRLHRNIKVLLWIFMAWGAFVTYLAGDSAYWFVKGYSSVLEMSFGIWTASVVAGFQPRILKRFFCVVAISALVVSLWSVGSFVLYSSMTGPFSNPNILGLYAVTSFPVVMSLMMSGSDKVKKTAGLLLSYAGTLFMILISFSTAAWVCTFFIVLFLAFMTASVFKSAKPLILPLVSILLIIVTTAGSVAFLPEHQRKTLFHNLSREMKQINIFNKDMNWETFTNTRSDIWKGTILMIREKPVTGWGWGQFKRTFMDFNSSWWKNGRPFDEHNLYLNMLFTGGVFNLVLFLILLYITLRHSWEKMRRYKSFFFLGIVALLFCQIIFSFAGNIFEFREIACIVWGAIGLGNCSFRTREAEIQLSSAL